MELWEPRIAVMDNGLDVQRAPNFTIILATVARKASAKKFQALNMVKNVHRELFRVLVQDHLPGLLATCW